MADSIQSDNSDVEFIACLDDSISDSKLDKRGAFAKNNKEQITDINQCVRYYEVPQIVEFGWSRRRLSHLCIVRWETRFGS